jgi:hypothetical protein
MPAGILRCYHPSYYSLQREVFIASELLKICWLISCQHPRGGHCRCKIDTKLSAMSDTNREVSGRFNKPHALYHYDHTGSVEILQRACKLMSSKCQLFNV